MIRIIRKVVLNYLVLVGILAHILGAAALIRYPTVWQILQAKLSVLIEKQAGLEDKGNSITIAFGTWSPKPGPALPDMKILLNGREYFSLEAAAAHLQDGDTLELGTGIYKTPLVLNKNGLTVFGKGHVIFDGVAAEGKAAIVIKGNGNRISNIECMGIYVSDNNGACVRLEGKDLTLGHVYFHNSEQGVLTGPEPGVVTIEDSRFESLGKAGRSHGIYIGGGELYVEDSWFIASGDEGHEIKSRAGFNKITRSVIASLGANDSRLIDVSNGGLLSISYSVLEKGPNSTNADLIGYGLEGYRYKSNSIELTNNIVLMERNGHNELLHLKTSDISPVVTSNVLVSKVEPSFDGINIWYKSRKEAGLKDYPYIPLITK
ncbi:MAG: hypothetical protein PHH11_10030 [Methylomonas sp.]|nr:hypothetical protein [Methylomonas sp.]